MINGKQTDFYELCYLIIIKKKLYTLMRLKYRTDVNAVDKKRFNLFDAAGMWKEEERKEKRKGKEKKA